MINIKMVSLKSDTKDLCKYIKSDSQLLLFKITGLPTLCVPLFGLCGTLGVSLSGAFLQTLLELVTPLMEHSLSARIGYTAYGALFIC